MSARLKVTILGCGSSGGVPRVGGADGGGDWGECDPAEPKNRRTRCSVLVERADGAGRYPVDGTTAVLVDTSPDLRAQLLAARRRRLDAVFFTHAHADQSHGVDDLRAVAYGMRKRVPTYIDDATAGDLLQRFAYCFRQPEGSLYVPILERRDIDVGGPAEIVEGPSGPIPVAAFLQHHGGVDSLGFRCGPIAYSSDVVELPEESFAALEGVDVWIVDALQRRPHKTHAHLDLALEWIARVKPKRAVLTNLHIDMDYRTLKAELPEGVEPAFDGMEIEAGFDG